MERTVRGLVSSDLETDQTKDDMRLERLILQRVVFGRGSPHLGRDGLDEELPSSGRSRRARFGRELRLSRNEAGG